MRKFIYLFISIFIFASCNNDSMMTEEEKKLINSGNKNTPMRVLTIDNEADALFLRTPSIDVEAENIKADKDLQLFIQRLKTTMAAEEGVGIAAPQVGIGRNIFLFCRTEEPDMPVQVAINPVIVSTPDSVICFEGDGCLSIPDVSDNSFRSPWVMVAYYDENGIKKEEMLSGYSRRTGFTGVVFQHEYDHLQGVLFIDKLCE
ncbi:peptide deformylase [Dysgonomonas sp. 25]|uniref:peptide deformylase n=1 Tax=Dysgonomonas sp. 25 TaxID=2302933 RepID=UPI00210306AB|nr:peptide deformylase [Dysgonomonas sp. 25]